MLRGETSGTIRCSSEPGCPLSTTSDEGLQDGKDEWANHKAKVPTHLGQDPEMGQDGSNWIKTLYVQHIYIYIIDENGRDEV